MSENKLYSWQHADHTKDAHVFLPQMEAIIEKRDTGDEVVTYWGCWVKGEWRSGLADDYDEALEKVLEHLQSPESGSDE